MFEYELNSWQIILEVINRLYPGFDAKISFLPPSRFKAELDSKIKDGAVVEENPDDACGFTYFDGDKTPVIAIHSEVPTDASIEIIAHEVAHVVAGKNEGHGAKWEEIFNTIHLEYTKVVEVSGTKARLGDCGAK